VKLSLTDIVYDNLNFDDAIRSAVALLENQGKSNIFFLNIDCLSKVDKDPEYREALRKADLILPDGVGLKLLSRLWGERMIDNCNGTDFSLPFLQQIADKRYSVFLLGGGDGVAQRAKTVLESKIPALRVSGFATGYFNDDRPVIEQINNSGADVLLVAMGVPLQEKWILRNRSRLNSRMCLGVGALFDFLSGRMPRAPAMLRYMQLEWAWRMLIEPGRLYKRYMVDDLGFLMTAVGKKIRRKK
jgi:N-acetylglucosaminyldiphosphoundecaprenol N-acetyl-beta-D-mannosaminyltransferase